MKKIIFLLLIVIIALACKKNNTVIVSGKISNASNEPIILRINCFDKIDTIEVNSDGTFLAEIDLEEEHLGWLSSREFSIPVYLIPGATINIEFNAEDLKNDNTAKIQITGKGSEPSSFLYSQHLISNKYNEQELIKMPVDRFAQLMKNAENNNKDELEKFIADNSPSKKFVERISLRQKTILALKYFNFIKFHKSYLPEDKTPIPDSFQEYIDGMPLNDAENSKEISEYAYFLIQYQQEILNNKMNNSGIKRETSAYINRLADEIIVLSTPQEIKDDIGEWYFSVFYKRPDSLRRIYRERYKDVVKNEEYLNEFEKIAEARDRLNAGNTAPTFNYPDINGKMVSLESFRGKVVYIDVWATWCGPCIAEFPYLKKLQNELKNEGIAFVSISIDGEKDKEAWEKMVEEKELGGYQLYAEGEWESKIAKDYVIRGIPYFIIIDKDGKLVEVFATRPSDPETKEKLTNLARS